MKKKPLISIIMGSKSDWPTMEHAAIILKEFKIPHEIKVISAHRTPKRMNEFSRQAEKRGIDGVDSILSIAQMPKGIPVGTLAIGEAGAANAALLAISILGLNDKTINAKYEKWRSSQTKSVPLKP